MTEFIEWHVYKFFFKLIKHEKKEVNPDLPVGVNKRIKQIADWDGHQGEHKHPCSC